MNFSLVGISMINYGNSFGVFFGGMATDVDDLAEENIGDMMPAAGLELGS